MGEALDDMNKVQLLSEYLGRLFFRLGIAATNSQLQFVVLIDKPKIASFLLKDGMDPLPSPHDKSPCVRCFPLGRFSYNDPQNVAKIMLHEVQKKVIRH